MPVAEALTRGNRCPENEKTAPGWCPGPSYGDPSGIRTRVTAVRGQRTRPLYDGAVYFPKACASNRLQAGVLSEYFIHSASVSNRQTGLKPLIHRRITAKTRAGIPGLEPRMTVPETVVLPITPYPNDTFGPEFRALTRAPCASAREITLPDTSGWHKSAARLEPPAPRSAGAQSSSSVSELTS